MRPALSLRSVYWFGWYTLAMGSTLLLSPAAFLPYLFGPMAQINVWTRLLGFVLLCSGYYYIQAAKCGLTPFAVWSVHTRIASVFVVGGLIITEQAPLSFLPMGIIDASAGLVTYLLIRNEKTAYRPQLD